MKILHLSTTDIKGGAGIAAYRLHKGLIGHGVKSLMFVQRKYGHRKDVYCPRNIFEKIFGYFCIVGDKAIAGIFGQKKSDEISPALLASMDIDTIDKFNPDIVNIHWTCGGFLNPEKIGRIKKPIVWTMHDMWPFSGISHYRLSSNNYINKISENDNFFNQWALKRKKKSLSHLDNLTVVSPSAWLKKEAQCSYLFKNFKIKNIPNGIDINLFKKYDKISSRKKYDLPLDKILLLFGAVKPFSNRRKGVGLLVRVIKILSKSKLKNKIALVVFGSKKNSKIKFNLPIYFIGKISDEKDLAKVYSAADLFIAPSEEDNLPNTVMESMACETPVVAFGIGGMPDMIDDGKNGILIAPYNVGAMAKKILLILQNKKHLEKLSSEARKKIKRKFNINLIAKKYYQLYQSILRTNE